MSEIFGINSIIGIPLFYIGALILTILIELGVTYVFRYRDKLLNRLIIWVNLLTNPLLNLVLLFLGTLLMIRTDSVGYIIILLLLEVAVVIVEYRIISNIFGKLYTKKNILWLVIVMNFASFTIGEVIKLAII